MSNNAAQLLDSPHKIQQASSNPWIRKHKFEHSINTANPLNLTFLRPLEICRLQIPRHTRQADLHPVNLLGHFNLTSQPRGLREAEGEIQHVVFVVRGFGHGVVFVGVVDDDVAGGAGAGSTAGTLEDVREVHGERRDGREEGGADLPFRGLRLGRCPLGFHRPRPRRCARRHLCR